MPALTEQETASVLESSPKRSRLSSANARSPVKGSVEQNRSAFGRNSLVLDRRKSSETRNGVSGMRSGARMSKQGDEEHANLEDQGGDASIVHQNLIPELVETIEADNEQALDSEDETEEREDAPGSQADNPEEEEEFQDALPDQDNGALDSADTPAVDTTENYSEVVDDSDAADASDEEPDPCLFCGLNEAAELSDNADLACTVCRKPAHHVCAVAEGAKMKDLDHWQCPTCVTSRDSTSPKETTSRPRQSASRLVRDLLPVSRGIQKPGAHSIFAQPLIQDEEGGRALRKRKSDPDERSVRTSKKPKKMQPETPKAAAADQPDLIALSTRRSSQKLVPELAPVRTSRILQHRPYHKPPPHKFILAFRLDQSKIEAILAEPPKPHRRKYHEKKKKIPAPPPYQPPVPKFPALPTHNLIFPAMSGDRDNAENAKPYGGILSETEAETTRSLPQMRDREIFEIARKEAEEDRKRASEKAEAEINGSTIDGANATNSKRTVSGPPSKIKCIQFGKHVIDTSYAAPYPEEYSHESRLFICEFCLKYLPSEFVAWRHKLKCSAKHPPGDEIYRDGSLSIWEVDGRKKTEYCQCLCLMAKLFLGSKTLYYDVDPFLFYILTEYDEYGYHFVGYFSKEKRPASQNNVSCILVMPIHQRKGYATFLIEFSYLLTRIEGKEGSPEKPLSDMGLTAYRSYWDLTISRHLLDSNSKPFSVKDIMLKTGMTADDVVHSLERLYAFIRDPLTKTYAIRYDKKLYETIVDKYESKGFQKIREERLIWTPYIMGRSDAAALDAQPVKAIAQRPEDIIEAQAEEDSDRVSPKTTIKAAPQASMADPVDPDLVNDIGHIAPGPPPTEMMDDIQPTATELASEPLVNGNTDKGKAPAEEPLSGYALAYLTEKIPPTRFEIDPPIPAAMIRLARSKRKSMTGTGTPRPNGKAIAKPTTPQAIRHSPRKAGSVNGSVTGQGSSRASTPDKAPGSVRRSGRRSGLAVEIVATDASEDQEEEEEDAEAETASEAPGKRKVASDDTDEEDEDREAAVEEEEEASDRSSERSVQSDEEEEEIAEESDASDDPDAVVEEDEDEDSGEEEDEDVELDVPSPISSNAVTDEEGSEEED